MKYTHNYMKIFLDTADTGVIARGFSTGLVDGVTTNPSLIMKSGRDPEVVYQEIKDIGVRDISMEVVADNAIDLCREGFRLQRLNFLAPVRDCKHVKLFLMRVFVSTSH